MKGYKKKKKNEGLQDSNKLISHVNEDTLYQWIWVPITEGLCGGCWNVTVAESHPVLSGNVIFSVDTSSII